MKSSAKIEVQLLTDALVRAGITDVIISPGSRNAPLSIAFDEHPALTCRVIPDERCAAFYALGMAQQQGRAVAIACTSGSAPVNYFPAVAEAWYQRIPLVVITADRPEEWVDQGDGQTINQQQLYGKHIVAEAQLSEIHSDAQRWLFERKVAETIQLAGIEHGPVHLNIPFTEPLYETTETPTGLTRWITIGNRVPTLNELDLFQLEKLWNESKHIIILCGQARPNKQRDALLMQLTNNGAVVLSEHTANAHGTAFIDCIDRCLNQLPDQPQSYQPDLLITLGGAVVSKRIKTFLRKSPELKTIRISQTFPTMDTYQSLVFTTSADECEVLGAISNFGGKSSEFSDRWKTLKKAAGETHGDAMSQVPFSDLKAMEMITQAIPAGSHVHVANSAVIRYALLFDARKDLTFWCNRGTSGIDGSTSTACGAALGNPQAMHYLITGDMSFFYDSNALWNNKLPTNLRILLINNGGGDIFNIIPGPKSVSQRVKFFVAEHDFTAAGICQSFRVPYLQVFNEEQLVSVLNAPEENTISLTEIMTMNVANSEILENYWKLKK